MHGTGRVAPGTAARHQGSDADGLTTTLIYILVTLMLLCAQRRVPVMASAWDGAVGAGHVLGQEQPAPASPAAPARKKRHPLAKVKGGWTKEEDEALVRCVGRAPGWARRWLMMSSARCSTALHQALEDKPCGRWGGLRGTHGPGREVAQASTQP